MEEVDGERDRRGLEAQGVTRRVHPFIETPQCDTLLLKHLRATHTALARLTTSTRDTFDYRMHC